ncbi:hypothetical protein BD289DRAFT_406108 [Coniella lustricola]|uniref:RING-type E3 ubiquitin transferase n=1 Tax=Coniella lustricola TaxID=2025994 RepID=A0A2T3ADB6_9PEZI|nr:hypothetical protein BD289DRAFT_406108 [Coniella lustricola]
MADSGAAPPTAPAADRHRGDGQRGRGRGQGQRSGGGRGRGRGGGGADGAPSHRGGGNRGRGRGGHHAGGDYDGHQHAQQQQQPLSAAAAKRDLTKPKREAGEQGQEEAGDEDAEGEVCFICANPIQHHAVAPCNHVTCHICALRMRALYKNKDCPHCRTPAPFVIFTDDPTKQFQEYTSADATSADDNIGIRYTNEDIVGDTVLLLRYNCPDAGCDFAGLGWPDLHRHVRQTHHKKMCDLCTRNKKVFTHEHELFTDKNLHKHMAHGDDRPGDVAQTGFKGHPLCGFCGERFYDDDKLYEHCRNKHERCFICDRRDSRSPHYYLNYEKLEEHFKHDHYQCMDRECLEKKFVVFESEMDLKAHQLSEHANSLSKDVRRDARMVDISGFDFRQPYQEERRGGRSGGGGGGGGREGRGRGRDPNAEPLPRTSAQPLSRAEVALQRMAAQEGPRAIHSAQSISNRTFGGQLSSAATTAGPTPAVRPNGAGTGASTPSSQAPAPLADSFASLSVAEQANLSPQDRARLVRHGAVIERASNLLGNDSTKMHSFRSHISSYKAGSMTGSQLIDAFFALFADTSSGALGTLVREVADLFEDKNKADALRNAWQDWRAINEDYPSLPGLGGMHGAATSSSGWASAASAGPTLHRPSGGSTNREKLNTRVLKLKNSTRRGSGAGVPGSEPAGPPATAVSTGPVSVKWTNVPSSSRGAAALASTAAFPALPSSSKDGAGKSAGSAPFWIGGGSGSGSGSGGGASTSASRTATTSTSTSFSSPIVRKTAASIPPSRNQDAFPSLPAAPKVHTTLFTPGLRGRPVRTDFGVKKETGFSWGGEGAAAGNGNGNGVGEEEGVEEEGEGGNGGGGKGKGKGKKKGKGKQVLAAWG